MCRRGYEVTENRIVPLHHNVGLLTPCGFPLDSRKSIEQRQGYRQADETDAERAEEADLIRISKMAASK